MCYWIVFEQVMGRVIFWGLGDKGSLLSHFFFLCAMTSLSLEELKKRIGLNGNERKDARRVFCEGEMCEGCLGYSKGENGKCAACKCDYIDHVCYSDEEEEFREDEYLSEYGGGETW